ncbi:F0F1 ATP synthase subunit B [Mangrovactinospora gilvigrisea]|uniref:ATP synthase subunit b n=1 Tax=Mangrovactinospora gilvigrisea TaxID=1428644 RepID=A0A1J7C5I9_9ACTN|nr:F0F1 ATP synthase subunit B [Mangrovactinospora gilvigrisea]OIV36816.1 F0F1 ATP synthase subunit B [Mangrovactinospora gilvigrisea]
MIAHLAAEGPQNPLVPHASELIIGLICFFIVFGILAKKLLPSINKVLEERQDLIEGGIERAEEAQAEAQRTLEQYREKLAEARKEANALTQKAQEDGSAIKEELRSEGQRQREAIVAAGHQQIEADQKQAAAQLRQDVGRLSVELAGRIVGESLEDEARQRRIVDRFLDELEQRAAEQAPADATEGSAR